jgi:hypothetical protein
MLKQTLDASWIRDLLKDHKASHEISLHNMRMTHGVETASCA